MSGKGILDKLNKTYGENAVQKISEMARVKLRRDSTGSREVDAITGGGLIRGRLIEIFGPESSGKTTLTLQALGRKQKKEKIEALKEKRPERGCAFIDMEHAIDLDYAEALGVDIANLTLAQPDYGEMALEIVSNLIESGEYCFIVVDSVSALRPKKEIEGEIGDAIVGLQAKNMSQACPKLSMSGNRKDCTVVFINQIRQKIGVVFGSSETTPGGFALKFHASMRLDIRNIGQILDKDGGERIGNHTRVTCIKNKGSKPFGKCETRIYYGLGIDPVWETFRIAVEAEIIKKSGSWFAFGETKLGQGENNVLNMLREDVDLYDEVSRLVDQAIIIMEE